jgi:UDP-glucuronate decarboxylase
MIRGLVAFMASGSNISGPLNLGNPNCEFTMNELAATFMKILKINDKNEEEQSNDFSVKYLPKTQDDPMCRKPVIEKALNLIDFKCNVELEDGIQRVWNYFIELDKQK